MTPHPDLFCQKEKKFLFLWKRNDYKHFKRNLETSLDQMTSAFSFRNMIEPTGITIHSEWMKFIAEYFSVLLKKSVITLTENGGFFSDSDLNSNFSKQGWIINSPINFTMSSDSNNYVIALQSLGKSTFYGTSCCQNDMDAWIILSLIENKKRDIQRCIKSIKTTADEFDKYYECQACDSGIDNWKHISNKKEVNSLGLFRIFQEKCHLQRKKIEKAVYAIATSVYYGTNAENTNEAWQLVKRKSKVDVRDDLRENFYN